VPPSDFELQMERADGDWLGTRVGFHLERRGNVTWVQFHHTGWPSANEHYRVSCKPVADPSVYEVKERALAILGDAQSRITRAVEQLQDTRLDAPFPDPSYHAVFPTMRQALTQVLVGHTANHVGQVGVWRRAMGLPRMARSFE
jgi:hypothetical protein